MFVVAAIIWGLVLICFIRHSGKKNTLYLTRYKFAYIVVAAALLLTAIDIWVFVDYIPTHFKKHPVSDISLSDSELLTDSLLNNPIHKLSAEPGKKDSAKPKQNTSVVTDLSGKTYFTRKASIRFFSHGDAEDIEAANHSVACSFNNKTGYLRFAGLIKGFQFENEIMQDHFNGKKYMNSEVFPKTDFTGTIQNVQAIDFTKDGNYAVTASGTLTIHGITKNITVPGRVMIKGNKQTLKSTFPIKPVDFGITTDELADEMEITVIADFD